MGFLLEWIHHGGEAITLYKVSAGVNITWWWSYGFFAGVNRTWRWNYLAVLITNTGTLKVNQHTVQHQHTIQTENRENPIWLPYPYGCPAHTSGKWNRTVWIWEWQAGESGWLGWQAGESGRLGWQAGESGWLGWQAGESEWDDKLVSQDDWGDKLVSHDDWGDKLVSHNDWTWHWAVLHMYVCGVCVCVCVHMCTIMSMCMCATGQIRNRVTLPEESHQSESCANQPTSLTTFLLAQYLFVKMNVLLVNSLGQTFHLMEKSRGHHNHPVHTSTLSA